MPESDFVVKVESLPPCRTLDLGAGEVDFKIIPFSKRGIWSRANKAFKGKLPEIVIKINKAMLE